MQNAVAGEGVAANLPGAVIGGLVGAGSAGIAVLIGAVAFEGKDIIFFAGFHLRVIVDRRGGGAGSVLCCDQFVGAGKACQCFAAAAAIVGAFIFFAGEKQDAAANDYE